MDNEQTLITASFIVTPDEIKIGQFTALSVQNIESKSSKIQAVIIYGVLALSIFFMFSLGMKEGRFSFEMPAAADLVFFIPPVILTLVSWAVFRYVQNNSFKRNFSNLPVGNKRIEYVFSESSVFSKVKGVFEESHQWTSYVRVVRTPKGFLYYTQPQLCSWIPDHVFQSKEDIQAVVELARRLVPKFFEA
jgi:hypothetical protein